MADDTTGKIVSLRGAALQGEPVPEVIETTDDLWRRAHAGDIRAIAYAVVNRDGTVGTGWAKPEAPGAVAIGLEGHGLGSGILTLVNRYGRACDD
jgi:hypothetical protein